MRSNVFFLILNHHKYLNWRFLLHLNIYVMGLRPLEIILLLQCGDRLSTSESDAYIRQILTYIDDPRTGRIKIFIKVIDPIEYLCYELWSF